MVFSCLLAIVHRNPFFCLCQYNKFFGLVIITKGFLKLPNLHMLIKQKESITSQKLSSWDFWQIANSVLNKGKSDKAKLLAETFFKNSNLDDSGISIPVFPSITNLKLHIISVTPKMVKNVITNLD